MLLRLLAPFLPYVTEEVWSWWAAPEGGSIHRAGWPSAEELRRPRGIPGAWTAVSEVLGEIRKAKTKAGVSLRAPVASVRVTATPARLSLLRAAADDLREAGVIASLTWEVEEGATEPGIEVKLA